MNSYIITDNGIMISIGMQPYNVATSHPNYENIKEALRDEDYDAIPELANVSLSVERFANGRVEVDTENGVVMYAGEELHGTIVGRILRHMEEGFSIDPLVNFLDNVIQNPSKRAVDELYGFLEYGKMPLTEDGCFLAYKRVRNDYKSCHDGKTDNSIGAIVEMPRNKVDDNSDRTCSYGLHFCSHEYLKSFWGEKVVVLKVNPADVVSIPKDYNDTKGRACKYEVVGELSQEEVEKALGGGVWSDAVVDDYDSDYDDADRDWDDEHDTDVVIDGVRYVPSDDQDDWDTD